MWVLLVYHIVNSSKSLFGDGYWFRRPLSLWNYMQDFKIHIVSQCKPRRLKLGIVLGLDAVVELHVLDLMWHHSEFSF